VKEEEGPKISHPPDHLLLDVKPIFCNTKPHPGLETTRIKGDLSFSSSQTLSFDSRSALSSSAWFWCWNWGDLGERFASSDPWILSDQSHKKRRSG